LSDPLSYFDRIVCINRSDRTDRWCSVQREFDKVGIRDRVLRHDAAILPNAELACATSHRQAVAAAKRDGIVRLLIFEDDVIFIDVEAIPAAIAELRQQDWRLFYLGGWGSQRPPPHDSRAMPMTKHLFRILGGYLTTHAYAISHELFDTFESKSEDAIDRWLAYTVQPNALSVGMVHIAATQIDDYSDIQKKQTERGRIVLLHNALLRKSQIII